MLDSGSSSCCVPPKLLDQGTCYIGLCYERYLKIGLLYERDLKIIKSYYDMLNYIRDALRESESK